jgi:hypothetical protein
MDLAYRSSSMLPGKLTARLHRRPVGHDRSLPHLTKGQGVHGEAFMLAFIDKHQVSAYISAPRVAAHLAQVAELVDALVSGTSGAIRGGSSPLLGTI